MRDILTETSSKYGAIVDINRKKYYKYAAIVDIKQQIRYIQRVHLTGV